MTDKKIIKIINEEISKFDFLGNDEYLKEQEIVNLLQNEDLQKQFICDSLINPTKIKIDVLDNVISDDSSGSFFSQPNHLRVEINLNVTYKYDQSKEPLELSLGFYGNNINISIDSDYDPGRWGATTDDAIAPSGGDWINYIDWSDIDVKLYTIDGDEIEFTAFKRAPVKIQNIFIREYCQDNIEKWGNYPIKERRPDKVQEVLYC